jgi:hypothetical protein
MLSPMRASTAVLLLVGVGCADSPTAVPTDSQAPARLFSMAVHPAVPISAACDLISSQLVSLQPPILQQLSAGECEMSHLGRVGLETLQTINIVTGAQTAVTTYTTRAGDLLYATSIGNATPIGNTTVAFSGTTTVTGGTGRFVGATGQMDARGVVDNATGEGWLSLAGSISYQPRARGGQ